MLKNIATAVVGIILFFLVFVWTRPASFRVERSAVINAPAAKIFPLINDFRSWGAWSPWERIDRDMQRNYIGPLTGPGSAYEWSGNEKIGKGRMEITATTPPSKLVVDLHFIEPFEARNTAEFTLVPQGESTKVTWAMYGPNSFMSKFMGLFMDVDKMIGDKFEAGLGYLKALAEQ